MENPYLQYASSSSAPVPANAYEYDVGILAQQSVYVPGAMIDKRGGSGGKVARGGKRTTVLRKGGGKTWEDQTLLDWVPCMSFCLLIFTRLTIYTAWFRLFVGDLSNDVSDDVLANAFNKYPTFQKARVIRDRLSQKAKYGFVAFSDPEDFLKAWKEMDGKYVGNRPIRLKRAGEAVKPVEIGHRRAKALEKDLKKSKYRQYPY